MEQTRILVIISHIWAVDWHIREDTFYIPIKQVMCLKSYLKEKTTAKLYSDSVFRWYRAHEDVMAKCTRVKSYRSFPSHSTNQWIFLFLIETPPPGYISEDGETSDQQLNQSMDTGNIYFSLLSRLWITSCDPSA